MQRESAAVVVATNFPGPAAFCTAVRRAVEKGRLTQVGLPLAPRLSPPLRRLLARTAISLCCTPVSGRDFWPAAVGSPMLRIASCRRPLSVATHVQEFFKRHAAIFPLDAWCCSVNQDTLFCCVLDPTESDNNLYCQGGEVCSAGVLPRLAG